MKNKKAFTIPEISVVLGLIVLTAFLVIPNLIEDNKKIDIISKWKNAYQNIEYVFSVLSAQVTDTDDIQFKKAKTVEEKENLLFELLNPYFRMKEEVSLKNYKTYYLNGAEVKQNEEFYIDNLHKTLSGKIVGVKWLNDSEHYVDAMPIALISVDLNGIEKPNKWGYDIFGVYIFRKKIEPVGKTSDEYLMKTDCSKKGKGISCSYYYYIYGGQLR